MSRILHFWTDSVYHCTFSFSLLEYAPILPTGTRAGGTTSLPGRRSWRNGTRITLPFAAGTPLVVVGSDANGFATGGTSEMYDIQSGGRGLTLRVSAHPRTAPTISNEYLLGSPQ
ncbi:hypothetical protein CALCODRAFT_499155 [Calocera cornea HHB12733]|uniref:Uncharacterized protein n=1 Tax=Calocera cornea HHB12733 TaxID=1353952 RepID=A0A165EIZ9_9BASI|nr:hypothetical protein CALCODRAFT_499155 [Calocera cornea HHB12733]